MSGTRALAWCVFVYASVAVASFTIDLLIASRFLAMAFVLSGGCAVVALFWWAVFSIKRSLEPATPERAEHG